MTHRTKAAFLLAGLIASGSILVAGPLNPPGGPVASTYKTLTEVEPRTAISATNTPGDADSVVRISQPGSYYLTGNLPGSAGKHTIKVAADHVTIDLSGMSIEGHPSSLSGIHADGPRVNLTVRNGTIRNIGAGPGLAYNISGSRTWHVENLAALNNGGDGIRVPAGSIVSHTRAASNLGMGIRALDRGRVLDSVSELNSGNGFQVSQASVVSGVVARDNSGNGIESLGDGVRVADSSSIGNAGHGILVNNGAVVAGCIVRSNAFTGITTSSSCLIERNDVTFSGGHGIVVHTYSIVRDNASNSNGASSLGAGVFTNGFRNRIEGNHCNENDYGVRVTASQNFIARNVVGTNTTLNWDIAVGNLCLVVQSAAAAAISGNSGGTSPGSTDPNANFTN
ncbi:MAG: right-handed parallel beta-helix repeat-containing protein [Phycisphaeraceae bacterium]|nr:MAG: right-handed parallel beta-helix repeat-containing protein [Phycisphaeraceae bacterium]